MTSKPDRVYQPDFAVPPGETIKELHSWKMATSDFTGYDLMAGLNLSEAQICKLFEGKRRISKPLAEKLEKIFDVPADFWLNLQAQYDETRERIATETKGRKEK